MRNQSECDIYLKSTVTEPKAKAKNNPQRGPGPRYAYKYIYNLDKNNLDKFQFNFYVVYEKPSYLKITVF